ncbi:RIO-like kinase [Methanocaldococcus vulcanius M7]|uniref:non-specific serine/threonine protein kinase n=1 Tax=Methanocaldococcus vulcanius (strain ATCC 700851 / DSM 12094 / M7) TaxID=579137 RepID=C9RE19_METVM|nr:serine/threonine-protein kinase RIO2 [Methanocaldococcus vulcanius]ACX73548.1 RIO-like kinase [Methanocaldococcus vulcanius M7]
MEGITIIKKLIERLKEAQDDDFKILKIIEISMRHYEWVPLEEIVRKAKMPEKDVLYRLKRLNKFEFVVRSTYGYAVSMGGYDALAINAFVKKGILKAVGNKLGVGKEGDVYSVLLEDGREAVLKFHKHGRTCFTRGKRYREYIADKHHISWLYVSRLSAEREFEILNELFPIVKVPEPIHWNRHAIIMGKVVGEELKRIDLSKFMSRDEIKELFWKIIDEVKKAYELGYIHGDLSEFNILFDGEDFVIIDWPQAVSKFHPEAEFYLKRDIENVIRYFKKYKIDRDDENIDTDKIFNYITGKS